VNLSSLRPAEPPVQPDAPTARGWAREELLNPAYHQQGNLLSRLLHWILEQLNNLPAVNLRPGVAGLVVAGVVALVLLIAWRVAGPIRRSRRAAGARSVLDTQDARTAAELRAAADAAAAAGDYSLAVAERFRAVVRTLEERALLDERPGRTAHEAAADGGRMLPTAADDLLRAGTLFDAVVYGHRVAGPTDDETVRAIERAVRDARPVRREVEVGA